jgi:hypothetical protein
MANFFSTRLNPDWYHGSGKKAPFFEGWYYKIVTKDEKRAFAIIPGVFVHQNSHETHAFVQVLDGTHGKATYHSIRVFGFKDGAFDVTIGKSHFTGKRIQLNIQDDLGTISGELTFENQIPMPIYPLSPGIMGWYGWLPFMECNHGIISFDHRIVGKLNIYGEEIDFTDGRGYIEKDWGTNFPSGYVWMQSNHFGTLGTSLSASVATIPNFGRKFAGFIVAFMHNGQLYRFSTYNRSKVEKLQVNDQHVEWVLYTAKHELRIKANRAEGGLLKSPERTEMQKRVEETMRSSISVQLNALDGFRKVTLFDGVGRNAGLEVVGDLSMLLK